MPVLAVLINKASFSGAKSIRAGSSSCPQDRQRRSGEPRLGGSGRGSMAAITRIMTIVIAMITTMRIILPATTSAGIGLHMFRLLILGGFAPKSSRWVGGVRLPIVFGNPMKPIARAALIFLSPLVFVATEAKAQSIFDVEHARAMYRAGVASRYDMEQLRRYGAPSGFYPQYGPPPPRRIDLRRLWWRDRYRDRYYD